MPSQTPTAGSHIEIDDSVKAELAQMIQQTIRPILDILNDNSDVFLGWTSWAAGNWWPDYELSEMPDGDTDVGIVSSCFAAKV